MFVGTTSYVSPEQAEGRPVDARSDIFSLGSVLYEMVTGRRAFGGSNPMSVLAAVIGKDPTPLSELVGDVPQELQRIVTRCLRKDPDRRFQNMSDVCVALDELGDELSESQRARARSGRGWRAALLMVAGLALVAVVAALWWTSQRPQVTASRQQLVSTFAGSHRAASFSPDGRMIAFVSDADGSPQVWVKNLSGGDPIQITRGVPARRPRWSPLNDQIVFERVGDGIWSVPPLGGEPRRITDGYGPNISADGRQIVFERSRQIWIAAADGTGARKIDGVPLRVFEQVRAEPALSPDGRTIAYFLPSAGPNGDLWTIPAAGGQPLRLTNDDREAGGPVWTRDGEFILFWSSRTGARTLWRVPARGGTPEPITTGTGEDSEVDLAADGRIIFTNVRNDWILTVTDPKDGSRRNLLERRTGIWLPKQSPDGQSIAFFADVEADNHVFVMSTSGGTPRQITFGGHQRNIHPIWSPDGQYLYYYADTSPPTFRRIPLAGGDSIEIAAGWRWPTHINPAIDPSGTRVAYHRQVPGETETTLVRELSTGRETVISEPGAKHLHSLGWSLDGQSILGWRHGDAIVICPAAGGPCRDVGRGASPLWSRDRSRIYFRRPTARPAIVEVWSLRTGRHRRTQGGGDRTAASAGRFVRRHDRRQAPLDGVPRRPTGALDRGDGRHAEEVTADNVLMVGETLSRYRITARLGAGAMCEVDRAEDLRLFRPVALKIFPLDRRRATPRVGCSPKPALCRRPSTPSPPTIGPPTLVESRGQVTRMLPLAPGARGSRIALPSAAHAGCRRDGTRLSRRRLDASPPGRDQVPAWPG